MVCIFASRFALKRGLDSRKIVQAAIVVLGLACANGAANAQLPPTVTEGSQALADAQSIKDSASNLAREAAKLACDDPKFDALLDQLHVKARQLDTIRNFYEQRGRELDAQAKAILMQLSDLIPAFGGGATSQEAKAQAQKAGENAVKDVAKDAIKHDAEHALGEQIGKEAGKEVGRVAASALTKGWDAAKVAKDLMNKMDIDIAREGILAAFANKELEIEFAHMVEDTARADADFVNALITKLEAERRKCPERVATGGNISGGGVTETPPPGGGSTVGGLDNGRWCTHGPGGEALYPFFPIPDGPHTVERVPDNPPPTGGGTPPPTTPPPPIPVGGPPPTTPPPPTPPPTTPVGGTPPPPTTPPPTTPAGGTPPPTTPPPPTPVGGTPPPPSIQLIDDTIHVTIFIKADLTQIQDQSANQIGSQTFSLFTPKPAPPTERTGRPGEELQRAANQPAPKCTPGPMGECTIDIPEEYRPDFGWPSPRPGEMPVRNFGVNVTPQKVNGGYVETTGNKPLPNFQSGLPFGAMPVFGDPVQIGPQTFVPFMFNTPYNVPFDVGQFTTSSGLKIEIDFCFVKEPGPPLGSEPASYSALNKELPEATLKLMKLKQAFRMAGARR
jgi:hypothetical protein